MNLRDLKYICELAQQQSFTKAAQSSFVSQSGLSMQIKKLEEELDVQIFERSKKSFLVTKIGSEIIKRAQIILHEVEEIKSLAKNSKDQFGGEIRIGGFPTLASYFFPELVKKISKKFPKLKIFLIEEKTEDLIRKLENGEIDAAFLAMPLSNDFAKEKIFDEEFLLAVPSNHELTKKVDKKQKIQIKELKKKELMLLEEGHCLRNQALEICSLIGAFEQQDFKATSLETLRQMVISGTGITLIPKIATQKNSKITYLKISNAPKRTIGLYWRKNSVKNILLKELAKLAKNDSF